jgi:hypothetical protein
MVIHFYKLVFFALILNFDRFKAFWICCLWGFFCDLFCLTTPLGFYSAIFGFSQLLYQQIRQHTPNFHSRLYPLWTFGFFFALAAIETVLVGYTTHLFEDLILGPLLDSSIFGFLYILVMKGLRAKREPTDDVI